MFYLGQVVYSESIEVPMIYLGRKKKYDEKGKSEGYSHLVFSNFTNNQEIDDWEFCDIMPLINRSGRVFKGKEDIGLLTGYLELSEGYDELLSSYLEEVTKEIESGKLKVLNLNDK
jgi:hypothetical protein